MQRDQIERLFPIGSGSFQSHILLSTKHNQGSVRASSAPREPSRHRQASINRLSSKFSSILQSGFDQISRIVKTGRNGIEGINCMRGDQKGVNKGFNIGLKLKKEEANITSFNSPRGSTPQCSELFGGYYLNLRDKETFRVQKRALDGCSGVARKIDFSAPCSPSLVPWEVNGDAGGPFMANLRRYSSTENDGFRTKKNFEFPTKISSLGSEGSVGGLEIASKHAKSEFSSNRSIFEKSNFEEDSETSKDIWESLMPESDSLGPEYEDSDSQSLTKLRRKWLLTLPQETQKKASPSPRRYTDSENIFITPKRHQKTPKTPRQLPKKFIKTTSRQLSSSPSLNTPVLRINRERLGYALQESSKQPTSSSWLETITEKLLEAIDPNGHSERIESTSWGPADPINITKTIPKGLKSGSQLKRLLERIDGRKRLKSTQNRFPGRFAVNKIIADKFEPLRSLETPRRTCSMGFSQKTDFGTSAKDRFTRGVGCQVQGKLTQFQQLQRYRSLDERFQSQKIQKVENPKNRQKIAKKSKERHSDTKSFRRRRCVLSPSAKMKILVKKATKSNLPKKTLGAVSRTVNNLPNALNTQSLTARPTNRLVGSSLHISGSDREKKAMRLSKQLGKFEGPESSCLTGLKPQKVSLLKTRSNALRNLGKIKKKGNLSPGVKVSSVKHSLRKRFTFSPRKSKSQKKRAKSHQTPKKQKKCQKMKTTEKKSIMESTGGRNSTNNPQIGTKISEKVNISKSMVKRCLEFSPASNLRKTAEKKYTGAQMVSPNRRRKKSPLSSPQFFSNKLKTVSKAKYSQTPKTGSKAREKDKMDKEHAQKKPLRPKITQKATIHNTSSTNRQKAEGGNRRVNSLLKGPNKPKRGYLKEKGDGAKRYPENNGEYRSVEGTPKIRSPRAKVGIQKAKIGPKAAVKVSWGRQTSRGLVSPRARTRTRRKEKGSLVAPGRGFRSPQKGF